jgi:rod shape-determining protein MreC
MKNLFIGGKNRKWPKFLAGAAVLLVVLFILNIFVAPVRNSFYTVSKPIQGIFWSAGNFSAGLLGGVFKYGSLEAENNNLKAENQKMLSQIATLQSIEQANKAQSDVSLACQNKEFQYVMAGVVGLDKDMISISKGSVDGIVEGMPVINQQNILVGKIFKVYKNFSDIMLVSNKNSVVNVKVQQQSIITDVVTTNPDGTTTSTPTITETPEIDGVVKGDGGLTAHLDLVPINSNLNPYDVLVTSSLEKSFPKDLLVGKIIQKTKNDQEPFQKAQISLFFNVKTADNLFVITNYKNTK